MTEKSAENPQRSKMAPRDQGSGHRELTDVLQRELATAGVRVTDCDVSDEEVRLSFDNADDVLALVAIVTSLGQNDDELYHGIMGFPGHPRVDASWEFKVEPVEKGVQHFDTDKGKRWGRLLSLDFKVLLPEADLPAVVERVQQHNEKAQKAVASAVAASG